MLECIENRHDYEKSLIEYEHAKDVEVHINGIADQIVFVFELLRMLQTYM